MASIHYLMNAWFKKGGMLPNYAMYWHILNLENYNYKPTCIKKWTKLYPDFSTAHKNIWVRIFKLPFKTVRDTKLQTFQYGILHHIMPCNECLFNIFKLKTAISVLSAMKLTLYLLCQM